MRYEVKKSAPNPKDRDHVYFRHLLVKYRPTLSTDTRPTFSADTRAREISTDIWSSVGRHVLQVGSPSVATIGRHLVGTSAYTRPTPRPLRSDQMNCRRHIGRLSVLYRSTFGGILCIVNRLFCWNILKCQPSPPPNLQPTQKNSIYRLRPYGDRANTSSNCLNGRHFWCNLRSEQALRT